MAFFKDSGFYADVDLSFSESIQWGKNRGCDFLNSCNTSFPEFVDENDGNSCSFYHFGYGYPKQENLTDNCHINFIYGDTKCTDPSDLTPYSDDTFEENGIESKCFTSNIYLNGPDP